MRNYKKEYKNYHGKTDQKKKRASRNTARARMIKAGKVSKGDSKDVTHRKSKGVIVKGKDVAHRNGNPKDNKKKNLGVASKSKNRSYARTRTAKKVNRRS